MRMLRTSGVVALTVVLVGVLGPGASVRVDGADRISTDVELNVGAGLLIADNMNRRLLITDLDGRLIWKFDNPTGKTSIYSGPLGVRWMPGGKVLATFGTGEVGVIDVATRTWDWKVSGFKGDWFQSPYDAEILPDGDLAVATRYNQGGRVVVYDRATGQAVWKKLLSNAHSLEYRTPAQSYGTKLPTIIVGGWGSVQEVPYQPGLSLPAVWRTATEYTHDVLPLPDGHLLTTEGYRLQEIDRTGHRLWGRDTPQEDRRLAINPNGGFIVSAEKPSAIEFRMANGILLHAWSRLSDGSYLKRPYGIRVIELGQVPGVS